MSVLVSRNEGYRRGIPKQESGLACAEAFFREVLGISLTRIDDATDNWEKGDFLAPSGATIECKGQGIDPAKFGGLNFVEVFEITENEKHAGGFEHLAEVLGIEPQILEKIQYRAGGYGAPTPLGYHEFVEVAIHTIANAPLTIYVNNVNCGHVYLYQRNEIMRHVVARLPQNLSRGQGRANVDTFGVRVPLADWRWSRDYSGHWRWQGVGNEDDAVTQIRRLLTGPLSASP